MRQINRDILKLAIPSILANITVPLVGMADIAVAGHLDSNAATMIGGIAVGSMLFDLLYWNFGFLRVGTGGLAAQAYGRSDRRECARIFARAVGIALACALVLIAIQWLFVKAAFLVVDCTPEVRELASNYFFLRIWAAPATLSLMAFKGWFIGMQDSVSPMITDFTVNGMNILMSIVLALGINVGGLHYDGMGFRGIAAGTVVAQYSGLLVAVLLLFFRYRKNTFGSFGMDELKEVFKGSETRRFFVMNTDLFVRSLCFIAIYIGFTVISARYGDLLLAVGSIMMKLLMIFSYFTDGFAYAGEAMTGRYIGAGDGTMLRQTVKWTFVWSMSIAFIFMGIYHFAGVPMLRMMTSDPQVVEASREFLPWLLLMPLTGCAAFTWDGIYIGATASRAIRNSMLWAVVGFAAVWAAGICCLDAFGPSAAPASGPAVAAASASGSAVSAAPASAASAPAFTSPAPASGPAVAVAPASADPAPVFTSPASSASAASASAPTAPVSSVFTDSAAPAFTDPASPAPAPASGSAVSAAPASADPAPAFTSPASSASAASASASAASDVPATPYGRLAMHVLMAAYFAHLLARTLYLSALYRKTILAID